MSVWDTLIFGGELDMLECRLYELQNVGDLTHVIVEADRTFQGARKPFVLGENWERFAQWQERIIYAPVHANPLMGAWETEHWQREQVRAGLGYARPDDLVLHSDVDEIPYAASVERLRDQQLMPCKLRLRLAVFAADWELPWTWDAVSAARLSQIGSFTTLRESYWPVVDWEGHGGWHLSWLGGRDAIRAKMHAFSHAEAIPMIEARLDAGELYERGIFWGEKPPFPGGSGAEGHGQAIAAEIDTSWPQWIYEGKCPPSWLRPRGQEFFPDGTPVFDEEDL